MGYDVKKLWKGNRLQIRYTVIYGGDGTRPSGEPFVLGVQGALGHKQKPQCVHISNVHADLLPTDVYSGMYARMTVNFFPYDASGNRGVGFGLGAVSVRRGPCGEAGEGYAGVKRNPSGNWFYTGSWRGCFYSVAFGVSPSKIT